MAEKGLIWGGGGSTFQNIYSVKKKKSVNIKT